MSDKKQLYELMSAADYMNICNDILATRREEDDGAVVYDEIEYTVGGVVYKVQGHHFPVQDVIEAAASKCKDCNSKGYIVTNVPKSKLPDPSGYFVDEEPEGKKNDFWRITTPCECGVKNIIKKNPGMFTIDTRCVFVDLTFTTDEKATDKPKIEIAR